MGIQPLNISDSQKNLAFASGILSMFSFALSLVNNFGAWSYYLSLILAPLTWMFWALCIVIEYRRKRFRHPDYRPPPGSHYPPYASALGVIVGIFLSIGWTASFALIIHFLVLIPNLLMSEVRIVECLFAGGQAIVMISHTVLCILVRKSYAGLAPKERKGFGIINGL
ncbi:hypothetical protein DL96DRAFT_600000 [Flagelloscypha sp. PMI_526]|nr:hypothetical protein DL96DRAFT_600000 [Flagelloscypha sp. PMI_526]